MARTYMVVYDDVKYLQRGEPPYDNQVQIHLKSGTVITVFDSERKIQVDKQDEAEQQE